MRRRSDAVVGAVAGDDGFAGESVTVTTGREGYSPIPYHTFEVPTVSLTTSVRAGETVADAVARVQAMLDPLNERMYAAGLSKHLDRIADSRRVAVNRGKDSR